MDAMYSLLSGAGKAVILDRDGVIIKDSYYPHRIEDCVFIPHSIEALLALQNAGYQLFVVTNQSGIGRGIYTHDDFHTMNEYMLAELHRRGIHIRQTYYCPHVSEDGCFCRKPSSYFLQKAVQEFAIDLSHSFVIGDKASDIEMGRIGGCKTVLVLSSPWHGERAKADPDFVAQDLYEASQWILGFDEA